MTMDATDLSLVLSRWLHVTSGVFWIGLLYYFNVVQVPVFKRFDAGTRAQAIQKLVPLALAWFRYTALGTVVFGLLLLYYQEQANVDYLTGNDEGVMILAGMTLGIIMFLNVWLVIWPNQRKIIAANREKAATGKEIPPESAQWAKQAFYASRTNFILSFPMLFFMTSNHFAGAVTWQEAYAVGAVILVASLVALWMATSAKPAAAKAGGGTPSPPPKP